jgi:mutual gliding-motility protein MglA
VRESRPHPVRGDDSGIASHADADEPSAALSGFPWSKGGKGLRGVRPCDRVGSLREDPIVVVVSYSGREINAKLVYYGCGLSGKTTNLESIYEAVPETSRGKMVSMKTQSDRTLFFDLLPLDLGEIMGFKTRFLLYTVPGQVFYNATRKLVLKGADAIVFVADSEVGKMEENKESLANLRANLAELGLSLDNIPWVIQHNKRDLPNVYTIEELNREINPGGRIPTFEAVATDGKGVFETFRGISHLLMEKVTRDLRRSAAGTGSGAGRPAGAESAEGGSGAGRQPGAPPVPREANEVPAQARAVDYGREIDLPAEKPVAARATPATGSASAAPAAPRPAAPPARPVSAPAPAAQAAQRAEPASQAVARPEATARPHPAPSQPPAPAAPRPGTAFATSPAPPGLAGPVESEELIVPIHLGQNGAHEIVLRIVLKIGG